MIIGLLIIIAVLTMVMNVLVFQEYHFSKSHYEGVNLYETSNESTDKVNLKLWADHDANTLRLYLIENNSHDLVDISYNYQIEEHGFMPNMTWVQEHNVSICYDSEHGWMEWFASASMYIPYSGSKLTNYRATITLYGSLLVTEDNLYALAVLLCTIDAIITIASLPLIVEGGNEEVKENDS